MAPKCLFPWKKNSSRHITNSQW